MAGLFVGETEGTGEEQADEERREDLPFFPDFALREALTAFALLTLLVVLASITKPPLEPVADPNASGYVPRPDWYFLWFFQSLRYFKGELEVVGTFVLPILGIALLISAPFLDRRRPRARPLLPRTRPVRLWPRLVGAGAMLVVGYLTFVAVFSATPMLQQEPELSPVRAAGKSLFDKMGCASCHSISGEGETRGPDLTSFGTQPDAKERVLLHFAGIGGGSETIMPGYQLSPEELRSLAAYLLGLKGK